jgi:hypothetical protein
VISLAVFALLAGAGAGGCGGGGTAGGNAGIVVNASQMESAIEHGLSPGGMTEVTSASCPQSVTSEAGAKFTCSARLRGGGSAQVEVTETRAAKPGEKARTHFSANFKPGSVQLPGASVDNELERALAASGVANATVNCQNPVKFELGTIVVCPANVGGRGAALVSFQPGMGGSIEHLSVRSAP